VIQRGDGADLVLEAFAKTGAGKFDRDIAANPRVPSPVDLAHPPGANGIQDFVRADSGARCQGHRFE
jgi:hypothetical protein